MYIHININMLIVVNGKPNICIMYIWGYIYNLYMYIFYSSYADYYSTWCFHLTLLCLTVFSISTNIDTTHSC